MMATCVPSSPALVTMGSGQVVSVPALKLLWRLEDVGMVVKVTGGRLLVGPSARLTSADVTAIRGHRDELIEIVQMCVAEVM